MSCCPRVPPGALWGKTLQAGSRPGPGGGTTGKTPDRERPAMTAGGGHAHDHALTATGRHRGRLAAVLAITLSIAAGEIVGGALSGALVLLADAAHMAADAAGVALSLLAAPFARKPATERRTFGYARAEILAATANALLLLGLAAFIIVKAVQRLAAPPPVNTGVMVV